MTRTATRMKHRASQRLALILATLLVFGSVGSANANGNPHNLEGKTLLAIFAHADDETTAGPLLAKYARLGVTVKLALVTDGRGGNGGSEEQKIIRAAEAQCSTEKLGIDPPILMEFHDGTVADDVRNVKGAIVALFEEIQPDIVVTWGPEGGYGHKDHRMVSAIVADVFQAGGEGWPSAVFFPGIPHFQIDNFNPTSPQGFGFKFAWGPVDEQYLQYEIAFSDDDAAAGVESAACHVSQFSPGLVADVAVFYAAGENTVFLRKSHTKGRTRTSLFHEYHGYFNGKEWGDDHQGGDDD